MLSASIMESFKMFFPSNVSTEHFPNNTATNYQTKLSKPIELEGEWEVGLESIAYSPKIGNLSEKAEVHVEVKTSKVTAVNDSYPNRYKVRGDGEWLGFDGIYPKEICTDPKDFDKILQILNNVHELILVNKTQKLFELTGKMLKTGKSTYHYMGHISGFSLFLQPKLAKCLGMSGHPFTGTVLTYSTAAKDRVLPDALTKEDYLINFFDPNVVKATHFILVKPENEEVYTDEDLIKLWNKNVLPHVDVRLDVEEGHKVVLSKTKRYQAIVLNHDFQQSINFEHPLVRSRQAAYHSFYEDKNSQHTIGFKGTEWRITVYGTEMKKETVPNPPVSETFYLQPRKYTLSETVSLINENLERTIKRLTGAYYNTKLHYSKIAIENNYCNVRNGEMVSIAITKNLSFMYGFDETKFSSGHFVGHQLPATLQQREQHLLVIADFIKPSSYGSSQLAYLREMVHVDKDTEIIERHFHPISYIGVSKRYIDTARISIVTENLEPIAIKDSKTLAQLHFRKVR